MGRLLQVRALYLMPGSYRYASLVIAMVCVQYSHVHRTGCALRAARYVSLSVHNDELVVERWTCPSPRPMQGG